MAQIINFLQKFKSGNVIPTYWGIHSQIQFIGQIIFYSIQQELKLDIMLATILIIFNFFRMEGDSNISKDTIIFYYKELNLLDKKGSLESANGKLINGTLKETKIFNSLKWKIDSVTNEGNHHYCLILGKKK